MKHNKNHWFSLYLTGQYPKYYRIPDKLLFLDTVQHALHLQDNEMVTMPTEYEFYYSYLNKVERYALDMDNNDDKYLVFLRDLEIPEDLIEKYCNVKTKDKASTYKLSQYLGGSYLNGEGIVSIEKFIEDWYGAGKDKIMTYIAFNEIRAESFTMPSFYLKVFSLLEKENRYYLLHKIAKKYGFYNEFPETTSFYISSKKLTSKTMKNSKYQIGDIVLVKRNNSFVIHEIKEIIINKEGSQYVMCNLKPKLKEKELISKMAFCNEEED